jgi:STE24 endopeptidase
VVAEAAVWLLRPELSIKPASVPASRYFSPQELDRARDFASGQRLLGLGSLALQGIVLVAAVVRPPRRAMRLAERATGGAEVAAGALVGAGLVVAVELAPLPLQAIARQRALDVGLATQSWESWAADVAKTLGIGVAFGAAGAAIFLALMRRFPRRWWIGGTAAVLTIEILLVWLGPVVLAPLFNRYSKLPEGRTRSAVLSLARDAHIDVGDVFLVDASRRTTGANAFVTGLGPTKRVVLYDTLVERFPPAEQRLVIAHEFGHVKHRDVPRGMLWVAIVAPAGMYTVMLLTRRWSTKAGAVPGMPASLPAFALALAIVVFGGNVISNQLSRRIEANADAFALELTHEPNEFIAMQRRLALVNLTDPDPPRMLRWVFGTHPSTMERIGAGLAFEREH